MTQILANKITITTFSLVPVTYIPINFTVAMGIFVQGGETGIKSQIVHLCIN